MLHLDTVNKRPKKNETVYRIYLDNSNPLFKDKNDCDYHLYCDAVVVCSSHTIPTK